MQSSGAEDNEERPAYAAGAGGGSTVLLLPPVARRRPLARLLQRAPLLGLLAYYVLLVAAMGALIASVPAAHRAYLSPLVVSGGEGKKELLKEVEREGFAGRPLATAGELTERTVTALFVILGTLLLVVPVARVYMLTKPLRYDEAVVRSVIILPIVVAGIAMVVVHSIALAFGLAGIVAAVRFRNTLKDPRDAVYIFLVIAIGLAAGVQALDVALVTSFAFNVVVLVLWWYSLGTIYGGSYGRTGVLAVGDPALRVARELEASSRIRRSLLGQGEGVRPDGILLVHSRDVERARETVQEVFDEMAKKWHLVGIAPRGEGYCTLQYLVRLKEKVSAPEMVGALHERWAAQVAAAEYIPFRVRREERVEDRAEDEEEGEDE